MMFAMFFSLTHPASSMPNPVCIVRIKNAK